MSAEEPVANIEAKLEGELDRLYGLPLDQFTQARDELARRARAEGQRAIAGRIKALRKPTVSAWVVNQLARENELDIQRLLKAGERLTQAHLAAVAGKDADAFLQARAEEQRALARLAAAARAILKREGFGAAALERISQTLRAAAVSGEGRELLKQGRLSEDLEPQGFDAFARVAPASRRRSAAGPRRTAREAEAKSSLAKARRRARDAAKHARELAHKADAAEREAERAEEDARRAREAATRARGQATSAAQAAADAEAEAAQLDARRGT